MSIRIYRLAFAGATTLALAACATMAEPGVDEEALLQTPTSEVAPPLEEDSQEQEEQSPTSTPTTPPAFVPALVDRFGFTLEEEEGGWRLIAQSADETTVVLEIRNNPETGEQTIIIETGDGQSREYPVEAVEIVPTIALGLEEVLTIKGEDGEVEFFYLPDSDE